MQRVNIIKKQIMSIRGNLEVLLDLSAIFKRPISCLK